MRVAPLAVAAFLLGACPSLACTSIAIGRDASASGYPIVTHSWDSERRTTDVRLNRVPRRSWPAGSLRPLYQWLTGYPRVVAPELSPEYAPVGSQVESVPLGHIPQIAETYGYWDTVYGVQNEVGLTIGESTCTAKTVGWPAVPGKPHGKNRVGIEDLTKIAMERCKTARCAIETMGAIAVEQGFYAADPGELDAPLYISSSECLAVADAVPGDLWAFHVMTGRGNTSAIWAAQRVPPDHVHVLANAFTIRKMRIDDPENFLYSPGVTELALENGWWRPEDETAPGVFDFMGAYGFAQEQGVFMGYGTRSALEFYSGRRMWRAWSLLSPEEGARLDPNKGHLPHTIDPYPFSVPAPRSSITVKMVMDTHRDHYEGTPYDLTKGMAAGPWGNPNRGLVTDAVAKHGQWERAISMYRTTYSHVVEARPGGRGIMWFGWDAPHGTAYLPFFADSPGAPEAWRSHEGCQSKFSTNVAWWAFNLVNQYADLHFSLINKKVRAKANEIEEEAFKRISEWDAELAGLDRATRSAALAERSNAFAEDKLASWWDFSGQIFAEYSRYVVTYNESTSGEADALLAAYPEWWLRSADVGFTTWRRDGPYHGIPDIAVESEHWLVAQAFSWACWLAILVVAVGIAHEAGVRKGRQNSGAELYMKLVSP